MLLLCLWRRYVPIYTGLIVVIEFCDGGNKYSCWTDARRLNECQLRKCSGMGPFSFVFWRSNCFLHYSFSVQSSILIHRFVGTHRFRNSPSARKNRHRPSLNPRLHPLQHPPCTSLSRFITSPFASRTLFLADFQILGMCFFLGGVKNKEQLYNSLVAQTSASMMTVSVASLLIPAAFHGTFPGEDLDEVNTLKISRASSIVLLFVYISYHPTPLPPLPSPCGQIP